MQLVKMENGELLLLMFLDLSLTLLVVNLTAEHMDKAYLGDIANVPMHEFAPPL